MKKLPILLILILTLVALYGCYSDDNSSDSNQDDVAIHKHLNPEIRNQTEYVDYILNYPDKKNMYHRYGNEKVILKQYFNGRNIFYTGIYTDENEPQTHIRELLYWYGNDRYSISNLVSRYNNNKNIKSYDIFLNCWFDLSCSNILKNAPLTDVIIKTMKEVAPYGYNVYHKTGIGKIEEILKPLSDGNPVIIIYSDGNNIKADMILQYNGISFILNNSIRGNGYISWENFKSYWSLNSLGKLKDNVESFGIKPYTLIYYSKDGSPWDFGCRKIYTLHPSIWLAEDIPSIINCNEVFELKHPGMKYKYKYENDLYIFIRDIFNPLEL